jgi:hypothetical protein
MIDGSAEPLSPGRGTCGNFKIHENQCSETGLRERNVLSLPFIIGFNVFILLSYINAT